jgi:hypothetical protein
MDTAVADARIFVNRRTVLAAHGLLRAGLSCTF